MDNVRETERGFEADAQEETLEHAQETRVAQVVDTLRSQIEVEDESDVALAFRPTAGTPFGALMANNIERRAFLQGAAAAAPVMVASTAMLSTDAKAEGLPIPADSLTFVPLSQADPRLSEDEMVVPEGYEWYSILRWGDSISPLVPSLDTTLITNDPATSFLNTEEYAAASAFQFGYNCDAVEFFPLPSFSTEDATKAIVCVNHEFITQNLQYPGIGAFLEAGGTFREYVEQNPNAGIAATNTLGITVATVELNGEGQWELVQDAVFNRRITLSTPIRIAGPAAGNSFLQTAADPSGRMVLGTYNNCAGGNTAYGSYLSAEENINGIFANYLGYLEPLVNAETGEVTTDDPDELRRIVYHSRLVPDGFAGGVFSSVNGFEAIEPRLDVAQEPNEIFRFGWAVEVDPYSPSVRPRKRTALGRMKRECATGILAASGQQVLYMGDDARHEYIYKFVSEEAVNFVDRKDNGNLLNRGTLYVAKFNEDGTGEWLPIDYATQPALQEATVTKPILGSVGVVEDGNQVVIGNTFTPGLGVEVVGVGEETDIPLFRDQGDVLVATRLAADILGATPMDRPEDVQANPVTRKVYAALTNATASGGSRTNGRTLQVDGEDITRHEGGRTFPISTSVDGPNPRSGGITTFTTAVPETDGSVETAVFDEGNIWGHILEITEDGDDNAATTFTWTIFLLAGSPTTDLGLFLTSDEDLDDLPLDTSDTFFGGFPRADLVASFGSPDNIGFDNEGNMLIVTDGRQPKGLNNAAFLVPTEGPTRGFVRQLASGPTDCEICGAEYTPDNKTVFLNIQHPGDGGDIDAPTSSFPFEENAQPLPSLIGVRRLDGGVVGS